MQTSTVFTSISSTFFLNLKRPDVHIRFPKNIKSPTLDKDSSRIHQLKRASEKDSNSQHCIYHGKVSSRRTPSTPTP